VERAIEQRGLEVDHREAGENAGAHDRINALLDAGDIFLRHRAADDLLSNTLPPPASFGSNTIFTRANWPVPAGLLLMRVVDFRLAREPLAIGHLRRANIGVDLISAAQNVDLDVEMEFAMP